MPKLDGTGPLGQGPMTGRQAGNCNGRRMGCGWKFWKCCCCHRCPCFNKELNKEELVDIGKEKTITRDQ